MIKINSLCVFIILIILIILISLISLILIYVYKTRLQEKEHFQAQTVMNINKRIKKYLDKNKKKKKKLLKIIKNMKTHLKNFYIIIK